MSQDFHDRALILQGLIQSVPGIGQVYLRRRSLKFFADLYSQMTVNNVMNCWEIDFESMDTRIASMGNMVGNIPLRHRVYQCILVGHYAFDDGTDDINNSSFQFRSLIEDIETAIWANPFLSVGSPAVPQLLLPITEIYTKHNGYEMYGNVLTHYCETVIELTMRI